MLFEIPTTTQYIALKLPECIGTGNSVIDIKVCGLWQPTLYWQTVPKLLNMTASQKKLSLRVTSYDTL
jgi:hypothetical protein